MGAGGSKTTAGGKREEGEGEAGQGMVREGGQEGGGWQDRRAKDSCITRLYNEAMLDVCTLLLLLVAEQVVGPGAESRQSGGAEVCAEDHHRHQGHVTDCGDEDQRPAGALPSPAHVQSAGESSCLDVSTCACINVMSLFEPFCVVHSK